MLWTPKNSFTKYQDNADLPIALSGVSYTAGANDVKGSWADLMTGTVTDDTYGIFLRFHSIAVSGNGMTHLADIGVDPAGGTAYTVLIPNLNGCCAFPLDVGGSPMDKGITYFFPIFIKAGSRLGVRGQTGHTSSGTARCNARLYQRPTEPHLCAFGTYVDAIGIDAANSRGTAVISALQPTEGSWTLIGALPRNAWWFQQSWSIDDTTMTEMDYYVDSGIGDGTSMRLLIENQAISANTSERMNASLKAGPECVCPAPAGASVRMRAMRTISPDNSSPTGMIYALG